MRDNNVINTQNQDALVKEIMKEYWLKTLKGDLTKTTLPVFAGPGNFGRDEKTRQVLEYRLPDDAYSRIMQICDQSDMAFFIFLTAALNAVLHRYSRNEIIIIGTTNFKTKEEYDADNILILKNRVSGNLSFKELLAGMKKVVLGAYKNRAYPFEKIKRWLKANRKADAWEFLNIAFISESLQAQPDRLNEFDLVICYARRDQRNWLCWEYNQDIYHDTIVHQFAKHFINFLSHVLEALDTCIEEMEILSEEDRYVLLHSFNTVERKHTLGGNEDTGLVMIQELFEQQVVRSPDGVAVTCAEQHQVTYDELNKRANQLACKLWEKGAKPGTIVALMLESSLEMVIGMLAVLKSGGVYLPIDPGYPANRKQYMVRDSCATLMLVHRHLVEEEQNKEVLQDFTTKEGNNVIIIDEDFIYISESNNRGVKNTPADPAYINYTSGTTGNPKGVLVSHGNVTAYLGSFFNEFDIGPGDTVLQQASYSFDVIVEELYPVLLRGGKLAVPGDEEMADIDLLLEFIVDRGVTFITCSPIMLSELNKRLLQYKDRLRIHTFINGGDVLRKGYIDNLLEIGNVYNTYGPTETTVCATYYRCDAGKGIPSSIPIGKPILNSRVYIVDARSSLVPIGVAGELCISGKGVSMGYLNQPLLTAERFVFISYKSYRTYRTYTFKKLYRTGDLARWLPDGNIEFLGRKDHQVKVQGYRVELEEIENRLVQHSLVGEAAVVVRENERGDRYLCAYIVPGSQEDVDVSLLREALAVNLPDYMIPPYIMILERIPLTPHGKVDRRVLPAPATEEGGIYTAPRTREEMKLVEIWSELLRTEKERIGIDSNFFRLGGHSLTATQLVYRVYKDMGVDLELRDVFIHPTVSELARRIKDSEFLEYVKIHDVEEREYYDLSYAQRRLWVLCQFEEDSTAYNMPDAFIMCGNIDVEVFKKALQALVGRHEGLRTVFIIANGEPKQKIVKDFSLEVDEIDLRELNLNPGVIEEEGRKEFREAANWAFDLEHGPLVLFRLVRLEEQKYLFITNFHHIINDAWSQGMMNNEVVELYNAFLEDKQHSLPLLELQYKDYTYWHNELIEGGGFADIGKYWLEKFKDKPNGIELPRDHPRRPVQTFNGRRVHFSIPKENKQRLYSLCLSHDSTLFMGLLTLVDIFMYHYTSQADIIVGSPIAGRRRKELQGIVGFLVNTLVYRNEVDPSDSFGTLLKKVREETLACYGNQDYPFDLLVDQLELQRDLSQSPLFNVMLAHNNADIQEIELVMKGVEISGFPYDDFNMSKFDLIFFMDEIGEEIYVRLEYNSDLFEDGTAERMAGNFLILTESVLSHPDQPLYSLDYIHPREYEAIVHRFNDNREEFPRLTVQELFEQQAAKTPEQTAVVGDAAHITYHELNKKANQSAHYLREEFSLRPGDIVGISIDRSLEMITAILGIIKSGAGYLAIDPTYPEDRVLHMLENSQCCLVIMDRARPYLFGNYKGKSIDIVSHWGIIAAKSAENPPAVNGASDVLYVIYTSGSTGTPNGAMLSHGILSNLVQWQHHKTTIDCSLRCLQFTSVNFCVSFQEIMITLTAGGEVHLIDDIERQDIDYLMDFLVQHRIQLLYLPFSYLNFLFNESRRWSQSFNHCLKHIITAGEQLKITAGLKSFLEKNPEVQLHNHYGSSEMHVVTSYTLDASTASQVPIPPAGQPIANTAIYILDEYDKPVPIGVWGELCIAGSWEVLGYIHNPVLTDQKLFFHPVFSKDNKRLYRSGDLGRWLEDGNIELKGRKDFQVKIRGFRVEPGEIESKILTVEGVRDCVVEVKESPAGKDQTGTSGQKYLVGYVVLEKKGANRNELDAIYRGLSHSLPQYMIPQLMVLDSLPLMPNGKVDREKLPVPEFHAEEEYTAPRNETEARLAQIWAELLGIEPGRVSVDANFFELGGHSLKATKMISEIHKAFHVRIPLTEVFQSPVISDLSKYISGAEAESYVPLESVEEKEYYDLSYAQRRLWILCQFEEDSTAYNMPGAFFISGSVDIRAFKEAVYSLVERHESLRTVFIPVNGEPKQKIIKELKLRLDPVDLRGLDREAGEAKARDIYREDANRAFNLEKGPLILFKPVQLENDKHLFIYNIHHIVNDGWSQGIIFNDLVTLYNTFARGLENPLPPLKFQYKDYTLWHNELIGEDRFEQTGRYWLEKFKDKPGGIELPLDHPRRPIQTFNGRRVPFTIDAEVTMQLRRLCFGQSEDGDNVDAAAGTVSSDISDGNATLFMVLLTLVDIFLYKYSGQGDILIGSPIAGRRRSELHPVVGFLVNTLVYRTDVDPEESFKSLLNKVRQDTLTCYENQDYPFDLLVDRLEPDRDLSQSPLFNVMLAHNNADTQDIELGMDNAQISIYPHADDVNMSKFDLIFFMDEMEDQIYVRLEYNSDLFEAGTVERMTDNFLTLTRNVIDLPQQSICRLDYIDPSEYQSIVQGFNDNEEEFPRLTVQEMFEQQAVKTPGQTAVVGDAGHITYHELNKKANQLARYLRKNSSVTPGDIVGISIERSIEMIIAILGIIKSGAGYLAIDPTYPEDRVLHMLEDSRCQLVIVDQKRPQLFGNYNGRLIDIVLQRDEINMKSAGNPGAANGPSDVLYVIYTSGSTGMPNGAMLSHGILSNLVQWQHHQTPIDCSLRCLQFTSVNFCVSFQEIMITLTAGGEVHLIGEIERQDIDYLMDFLVVHRIQVLYLPFSYLNFLFNESGRWNQSFNHCLKHIITAGEQLKITSGLKRFLEENPDIQLHNHYGSSEMHVVTSYTLDASSASQVPIPPAGQPIANTAIYILDEYDKPVPIGVWGELCIAGSWEVLGYIHNPRLTDEKLFLHPVFSRDNKRLYRSGDLGRWLEDGNIELKGRKDFQVKIRGFRVEPGEIESKILSIEGVRDCVVEVKEAVEGSSMWKTSGQKYLVAYVVGDNCNAGEIKRILGYYLPQYMIPHLMILESLPLMPNGKVDREKLPEPEFHVEEEYTAPRNEIETRLVEIWSELLGIDVESISIHSNFFELGGHSLKATRLTAEIHKTFNVKVPLTEVFRSPVVKDLSEFIAGAVEDRYASIGPVEEKEYYELSSAQKRLYYLQQLGLQSTAYNMPYIEILDQNAADDGVKLEQTFNKVIRRHESLRTSFHMVEGNPVQRVQETIDFEIEYYDADIIRNFVRPFDLVSAPLMRAGLLKIQDHKCILMVDMHHIIADGISSLILVKDFIDLYNGEELPELRLQYKDYAWWQILEKERGSLETRESYWVKEFAGDIPILNLPIDYPRPEIQEFEGGAVEFELGNEETAALQRIAFEEGATIYMVLLALYTIFLSKITGQEDIVVGTPTSGRRHVDLESIIGMFVNTLPLRNYPSGEKTVVTFLEELKENTSGAFENQDYPFEDLVEILPVERDTSRNPIFDVMFNWWAPTGIDADMNMHIHSGDGESKVPGEAAIYELEHKISKFDITLIGIERNETIAFAFEYCTKVLKRETIERFIGFFKRIVGSIVNDPFQKISGIHIISEKEKDKILYDFNKTDAEYPADKTIHRLFEEQVTRTPDRVALVGPSPDVMYITYGVLNEEADRLAFRLKQKGVQPDTVMGIMIERSIEMVVGILGILKAGGAYMPIDPGYPRERIDYILKDSNARFLVSELSELSKVNGGIEVVKLSELREKFPPHLTHLTHPTHLSYIIYTSGSTGKPKGVMVNHGSVVNLLFYLNNRYPFEETDTYLLKTPYIFDVSVTELFGWFLGEGGRLAILTPGDEKDPETIIEIVEGCTVTHINFVPSMFRAFVDILDEESAGALSSLKYIFLAGEELPGEIINRFRELNTEIRLENIYGPTEAAVYASKYSLSQWNGHSSVPIGKPVQNTKLCILDKYDNVLPVGIPGELCIVGDGVARGYLNRPGLTADKFLSITYKSHRTYRTYISKKIYKSGDLTRWLPDGNIEFLGRLDHQVKVRGFRIELGEIEAKLLKHEKINEAVVVMKKDDDNNTYLCAYVIPYSIEIEGEMVKETLDVHELGKYLSGELPEYMVPSYFVQLEKIPVTPSGKRDRNALPEPKEGMAGIEIEYAAPGNFEEEKLVEIWAKILKIEKRSISVDTNFYELGGHSLSAISMVEIIHKILDVKVPLKHVLKKTTVKQLALYIRGLEKERFAAIEPVEEKEYYVLSSAQKRIYILQQMDLESSGYNMPFLEVLEGDIDKEKLGKAFKKIIKRHESLRTSFHLLEEVPVQRVHDPGEKEFEIEYFSVEPGAESPLYADIIQGFIRPFDLSQAPLLRVRLIKQEEKRYILMVDMHHIISDGHSLRLIVEDFKALYDSLELPRMRLQYKDYAEWQNRREQRAALESQETYWLKEFRGEIPVLTLPTDFARPVVQRFEGHVIHFELGERETMSLHNLARVHDLTPYMVLLTIYYVLLSKLSGQQNIVVGTPVLGRRHADLENIIGMFVNTLPLRNDPVPGKRFKDFLKEVGERALSAFENQEYPFEELVDRLTVPRDAGRNPLFDVMFSLQELDEIPGSTPTAGEQTGELAYWEKTSSKFDMTVTAVDTKNRLFLNFTYNTALFKRETIHRFIGFFKEIVLFVTANVDFKLSQVEIMTVEEKQQVLVDFNKTETRYPVDKTINQLFTEQVERTPHHIAVVGADTNVGFNAFITYRQLNERSNQLAYLLRQKGVKSKTVAAIMTPPCLEMVIGIMAVLKAGGCYLPIDPENPAGRISYILRDSNAMVLLGSPSALVKVEAEVKQKEEPLEIMEISVDFSSLTSSLTSTLSQVSSADLAYLIYTSGTSGKPKGVLLKHENLVNYVNWFSREIGLNTEDKTVLTSSFAFDLGYTSIYPSLLKSGQLHILSKETYMLPGSLLGYIGLRCITYLKMTPSLFGVIVRDPSFIEANCRSLRLVVLGGEAINVRDVERAHQVCSRIEIMNHYGPTEVTVGCIAQFIDFSDIEAYRARPTIGGPIDNTKVFILDRYLHVLPASVAGELCLGGVGVARGYLNRTEITAEKFLSVSCRTYSSQKIYKTGDLARWLSDGNIEFLGRIDQQVKVSGYRIEPGEIESHLMNHEDIKEAVVMVRTSIHTHKDDKYLCAYIVLHHPAPGESLEYWELKSYLSQFLPDYMIPSYFVELQRIPLTPNGKLNRKALPEPSVNISRVYMGPRNAKEEKLVDIWSDVLEIEKERISINANFFELGGQSLKAIIMISNIHRVLNVKIQLAEIFKNPTISGISSYIKETVGEIDGEAYVSIKAVEERDYYELSSAQKRIYILQQMEPKAAVYNMPQFIGLEGEPDPEQLAASFRQLIDRHESLRTSFILLNEEPVQRIHEQVEFKIEYYEAGGAEETILQDFVRPFDLLQAPMLRVGVVKAPGERYVLLTDMHHIISDGFSRRILTDDFMALARREHLPGLRIQYKDFSQWQNSAEQKDTIKGQEAYWLKEFAGEIPVLDLPTDYARPSMQSFEGSSVDFVLGVEETGVLRRMVSVEGVTLYMILLAVCYVLLSKLSSQEDIVMGTPVLGRRHADLEKVIGMFVNTLALRNNPGGNKSFKEFLEELKGRTLKSFENQNYQFEELVEKVTVNRDTSRNPLFDVMFVFQNIERGGGEVNTNEMNPQYEQISEEEVAVLQSSRFTYEERTAKFDLTISAVNDTGGNRLLLGFQYCTRLFKRETINRFAAYFKRIITSVLENKDQHIAGIDMLSEEEKYRLLVNFSNAEAEYLPYKPISQLLEEQVSRTPGKVAVAAESCLQVTYRDLNERANELAAIIRASAGENNCIGIMFDDNPYLLTSIFAVIKSGNWFVPIAPNYPDERIYFILNDCGIKLLLTDRANHEKARAIVDRVPYQRGLICMCIDVDIDEPGAEIVRTADENKREQEVSPRPCYIIYTSGSTGRPKGVLITQENVVPLLVWSRDYYKLGEDTRVLQSLSYSFDFGVFEILTTVLFGGTLYQGSREELLNLTEYVEFIDVHGINTIHTTPSFFNNVVWLGIKMPGLRIVHLGGEMLTANMVIELSRVVSPDCMIYNGYGPTEASVNSSIFALRAGDVDAVELTSEGMQAIPIGKPSANNVIYILDKFNNLQPVEVAGELCVSGRGVSMGYLNRPELTAEKFLSISYKSYRSYRTYISKKLYKTGDLARWLWDGNIEFLGRIDQQVKIRGFRIEPGEIENRLLEMDRVKKAVVIDREINGEIYLCAYIVLAERLDSEPTAVYEELRKHLSRGLPDYMVPSHFMLLEKLPLTPTGKTDRKALPEPEAVAGAEYVPPGNEIEEQLVEIWSEVLGVIHRPIGINDNFFELGGHSLNAISMLSRIHKAFDIKVPLMEIFRYPTIQALSEYINRVINNSDQHNLRELSKLASLEKIAFDVEFNI